MSLIDGAISEDISAQTRAFVIRRQEELAQMTLDQFKEAYSKIFEDLLFPKL